MNELNVMIDTQMMYLHILTNSDEKFKSKFITQIIEFLGGNYSIAMTKEHSNFLSSPDKEYSLTSKETYDDLMHMLNLLLIKSTLKKDDRQLVDYKSRIFLQLKPILSECDISRINSMLGIKDNNADLDVSIAKYEYIKNNRDVLINFFNDNKYFGSELFLNDLELTNFGAIEELLKLKQYRLDIGMTHNLGVSLDHNVISLNTIKLLSYIKLKRNIDINATLVFNLIEKPKSLSFDFDGSATTENILDVIYDCLEIPASYVFYHKSFTPWGDH